MTPPPQEEAPVDASTIVKEGDGAQSEPSPSPNRPVKRGPGWQGWIFYTVWIVCLPFGLAILSVWALTPATGNTTAGVLRVFVADQPIPAGIVLFTLFAMIAWHFRYELPLASAISIGRKDIPPSVRSRYEDAVALLDEAQRLLRQNKGAAERMLLKREREQLDKALAGLEAAMDAPSFDVDKFDAAHAQADRAVVEHLSRWRKGEAREYVESIGVAVAVAMLLRGFVIEAFKIPSGSMIPSLMIGDHIFVNKLSYGPLIPWTDKRLFSSLPPSRGDVMVFKFPENKEQDFIKRVIALPGDKLESLDGRPILNGWLVPHCHVGPFPKHDSDAHLYIEYLDDKAYFTLFDRSLEEQSCTTTADCRAGAECHAGTCGVHMGPWTASSNEVWVMGDNRNNSHDSRFWNGQRGAGVPLENIRGRAMFVWVSFSPGGGIAQDRLLVNVMGRPTLPASAEGSLQAAVDKCLRERPPLSQTTPPGHSAR